MRTELTDEGYVIETLLRIADKAGNDVDFILNSAQKQVDLSLEPRNLIPKARQEGVSSYFLARSTVRCLMKRNTRAVVISHDQESTQRMLSKVQYFINEIKGPRPVIKNMSASEITFPKTNSMFYIGTAGSRRFGRGDTITDLHCSEYAYWPDPKPLMAGLLQAVPLQTGFVSIESTGNGMNDYYHRCMRAQKGQGIYKLHFLPWHTFEEYKQEFRNEEEKAQFIASLDPDLEEDKLASILTPEQLYWRRIKLEELDYDLGLFKQEYPMTLEECFQMSGFSIFHRINYIPNSPRWLKEGPGRWRLKGHPVEDFHYTAGADVAAGVQQDSSVVEVFCLETGEQVYEYVNNKVDPEAFGFVIAGLAEEFNNAYTVVENNNHGILTLSVLSKIYPTGRIYASGSAGSNTSGEEKEIFQLGYRTSSRTKPLMIGRLRTALARDLKIYSSILNGELSTFIEDDSGRLGAQEDCHDDTVIASACAVIGFPRIATQAEAEKKRRSAPAMPDFSLENIVNEMRLRGSGFPIRAQVGLDLDSVN